MQKIYFDNAATTPVDKAVLEAMLPYFQNDFGNASSIHTFGLGAKKALDAARSAIAKALHAHSSEIVFTAGGTEANNLAIFGIAEKFDTPQHLITSSVEHPSVLQACKSLEKKGWRITCLRVNAFGEVAPQDLAAAIRDNTALVSIMTVNNETGTVQPVTELAEIAAARKIPFHTDAVQAFAKIPIDLQTQKTSLLSVSSHKIYGPKGVGALFVRKGVKLSPIFIGGGQEEKRRAGTENIPAIVGFGKAAELAMKEGNQLRDHLADLTGRFIAFVEKHLPGGCLNSHPENRVPGIVSYSFPGIESLSLVMGLDLKGIAISNGSACSSGNFEPSHVLKAMNLSGSRQRSAVRFSFGKFNTEAELKVLQSALLELTKGRLKCAGRNV
jgi:cysteine desulfurase